MATATRDLEALARSCGIRHLPVCPAVLTALMRTLENPDATTSDLAQVLSADQTLTVKVLKIINSAYYGLPRSIKSVEEAAFRLGFKELWSLAVSLRMGDVFHSQDSMPAAMAEALWGHSINAGMAAKALAKRTRQARPDELFTIGMVHDIGKLVLFGAGPERALELYAPGQARGRALVTAERLSFGLDHAELGGHLLLKWRLPESLAQAVGRHHEAVDPDHPDAMRSILALADTIAHAASALEAPGSEGLLRLDYPEDLITPADLRQVGLEEVELIGIATAALEDARNFRQALA